ncbi:hypothetical protein BGW41_002066 [Actinomortierella wolfii]|nr:hypothetical protein BGW41_002066 [Actinomortierella wolfii]
MITNIPRNAKNSRQIKLTSVVLSLALGNVPPTVPVVPSGGGVVTADRFIVNQRVKGPKLPPNPLWISHKGIPKVPTSTSGDGNRLISVGYFAGWTQYRGIGNKTCQQRPYLPSSIPWSSLDYVMFAFAYFDDAAELYPADPADEKLYFQINQLKVGTNTRVLLSVGGWSFINPLHTDIEDTRLRFENMVQTPEMRRQFIDSCITFCEFYGFDGIDIDWEYPSVHLRPMVTQLFQEMRRAFDNHGHGLILTVAGGPFRDAVRGFDFDKIANDVDFFMIMAYDMYGAYDPSGIVNIHTSLLQMPTEHQQGHSVQGAVELYVDLGVPRDKIVLGIALYGKTYTLANHKQITPGIAQFQSPGAPTNCMESPGDIAYNEIAALLNHRHKPQWDSDAHAFYFVYGQRQDTWVGYDDRPSIDLKLQLITENELAGFMWWSLDQDLDRTSAWAGAPMANRDNKTQQAAPSRDAGHQLQNCPSLAKPPENFASIPANQLGQPGLVVYAAQKRTHCPAYVEPTVVLPPTPLGNTVFVKCPFIPGCPVFNDAYQAYTCTPQGWSQPSQCYAPTSYFFGELQLVRATVRDRNEPGADGFLDGFPAYIRNHHHRPPPPKSVESILHENSDLQWTKDILRLQRKLRDDTKKKKNERKEF